MNIPHYRLYNQQIAQHAFQTPGDVVAWLGAVQAQDFAGAKWSLALRLHGATDTDIIQAIDNRTIVRTWPMRGTLHFVAAADIRWMLELMTPRVIASSASRAKNLELTDAIVQQCKALFTQRLEGGNQLTREEMYEIMEQEGISTANGRGNHILWRAAQEGDICFASHQDKQPAYALLDEWVPPGPKLSREEALAELVRRYYTSHGPATVHDLVWWSGLKVSEIRKALSIVAGDLIRETVGGVEYWMTPTITTPPSSPAYLLPGFDEYLLGYKDRSAVLDPQHASSVVPGNNGMFMSTIILDGRVVGLWKRTLRKNSILIQLIPFTPLSMSQMDAIDNAATRYGEYMGMAVSLVTTE